MNRTRLLKWGAAIALFAVVSVSLVDTAEAWPRRWRARVWRDYGWYGGGWNGCCGGYASSGYAGGYMVGYGSYSDCCQPMQAGQAQWQGQGQQMPPPPTFGAQGSTGQQQGTFQSGPSPSNAPPYEVGSLPPPPAPSQPSAGANIRSETDTNQPAPPPPPPSSGTPGGPSGGTQPQP
jgi:hypothetical protein